MAFPKFHGINLAANSWIENCVVERLSSDPTPATAGRLWYNTVSKQLKFSSLDGSNAVIVEVIATGAQVAQVISDLAALGARVTAVEGAFVNKDGSVAFTGDINAGNHKVINVTAGSAATDGVNKGQLDAAVAALGNAFDYVGTVVGGATSGAAFDMTTAPKSVAGSYYKVTTAGYFKVGSGGTPFFANTNDGLAFNTTAGVDVIDNTDSTVAGTAGHITVTGTTDTGYTVDIASAFVTQVDDATSGLAAEVSRATSAEGVLTTNLASEVSRATGAEGALNTAISNEVTRATAAEGALSTAVSNETAARTSADNTLTTDLASEVSRATAAEGTLTTNLAAEVTRATAAEGTLTTNLATEVTRATAAEGVLTTDLASEVTRATAAEGAEATARAAADSTLTTNLASEVSRATAAEGVLTSAVSAVDTKVGSLSSLVTTDKSSIVNAINEVSVAAGSGTDALRVKINDQRFTFLASSAALTHIVSHGLSSTFTNVQVWVKGDDDVFRNDLVAVEETSSNSITVSLTEARIVKVTVQAMDDIAA